jgi:hypothetical protein
LKVYKLIKMKTSKLKSNNYPGAAIEKNYIKIYSTFIFLSLFMIGCTLPTTIVQTESNNSITEVKTENKITESPKSSYEIYTTNSKAAALFSKAELEKQKIYKTLTEALKEPDKVFRLHLTDLDMNFDLLNLSPRIGELYNVQDLVIDGVYEKLPKEIGKLTQIQKAVFVLPNLKTESPLELTNWKNIKSLTIDVYTGAKGVEAKVKWTTLNSLICLEELRLENKGITNLPKDMFHFAKLRKLDLINTSIDDLSELGNLSALTHLTISMDDKVSQLPDGNNLSQLKNIDFDGLPNLTTFFTSIKNKNLSSIRLINCPKLKIDAAYFNDFSFDISYQVVGCPLVEPNEKMIVFKKDNGFESKTSTYPTFEKDEKGYYEYMNSKKYSIWAEYADKTKDKSLVTGINFFLNDEIEKKVWSELSKYKNLTRLEIDYNNGIDYSGPELTSVEEIRLFGAYTGTQNTDFANLIKSCPNLKKFQSDAGTITFPITLYDATQLESLDITIWEPNTGYKLNITDKIGQLKNLKKLNIYLNDFFTPTGGTVSKEINTLTQLEELQIIFGMEDSKSTKFTYPNGIENLVNLKSLSLGIITADPIGIEKLNLKTLKIDK